MLDLLRDVRFAIRGLARAPAFALSCLLTIAVGIGATTAIYSVVHGVLLRPLAFPDGDELVTLWGYRAEGDLEDVPLTPADFVWLDERTASFESVGARWSNTATLTGHGEAAQQVSVSWVTPDYFSILGIRPVLGRDFVPGQEQEVILGEALWRTRFGSDPAIVGSTIQLAGEGMRVLGVLPGDIDPNLPGAGGVMERTEMFRLMQAGWISADDRSIGWLRVFGRLRDGVTVGEAQAELDVVARAIREQSPEEAAHGFALKAATVRDSLVQSARSMLLVLFGAVFLVLSIACANVASLLLVRGQHRVREMSVRAALGGGRMRILRQLLTESAVLGMAGGSLGVGLSYAALAILKSLRTDGLPRADAIQVDASVLLFAAGLAVVAVAAFGVVPAFRLARVDLGNALRARAGTPGRRQLTAGRLLIAGEVALSLVLLSGAGVMLRSALALSAIDPGFETRGTLTFSITPPPRLETAESALAFGRALEERLAAVPGVTAVGMGNRIPLGGGLFTAGFATDAMLDASMPERESDIRLISPAFVEAMGGRLLAGRTFVSYDEPGVVLVDTRLAHAAWPGVDPIGQRVRTDVMGAEKLWFVVVGVVEHMRHDDIAADGRPTIYLPIDRGLGPNQSNYVAVRTSGDAAALVVPIREALRAFDADAPMARVRTIEDLTAGATAPTRFALWLIGLFAAIAVGLTAVGLAGAIAYAVAQRQREFGLRVALGATSGAIVRLVMRDGVRVLAMGGVVGLAGVWVSGRAVQSFLYEVAPFDPVSLVAVTGVLISVGMVATYLPARRAMGMEPVKALRGE